VRAFRRDTHEMRAFRRDARLSA